MAPTDTVTPEQTASPAPQASPPQSVNNDDWVAAFITPVEPQPESVKAEEPAKVEEPKVESPKAEAIEKVEPKEESESKRLKDTRDWATRVQQTNLALEQRLAATLAEVNTLKAKIDGTYEEPTQPSAQEIECKAVQNTALVASQYAAMELLAAQGVKDPEGEINRLVWAADAPFQELQRDPAVLARVNNAKLPVVEAIKVVREAEARKKYGNTPDEVRANLRAEIEKEIKEATRKEVMAELKAAPTKKPLPEPMKGLGEARGVAREETRQSNDQPITLENLFPNFVKTHDAQ